MRSVGSCFRATLNVRDVCKESKRQIRRMIAKWWNTRIKDLETAAEHGDSRSLHDWVKRLIDFLANEDRSRKVHSRNHEDDHTNLTHYVNDIMNINRAVNPSVFADNPDISSCIPISEFHFTFRKYEKHATAEVLLVTADYR